MEEKILSSEKYSVRENGREICIFNCTHHFPWIIALAPSRGKIDANEDEILYSPCNYNASKSHQGNIWQVQRDGWRMPLIQAHHQSPIEFFGNPPPRYITRRGCTSATYHATRFIHLRFHTICKKRAEVKERSRWETPQNPPQRGIYQRDEGGERERE